MGWYELQSVEGYACPHLLVTVRDRSFHSRKWWCKGFLERKLVPAVLFATKSWSTPNKLRSCIIRHALPSAASLALAKGTRQRGVSRVAHLCWVPAHGKKYIYHVPLVCWVPKSRHSVKVRFAECPMFGTRQTLWHTAYPRFPVVLVAKAIGSLVWSSCF